MRRITITLPDPLYSELEAATAKAHELCYTPEMWATEAVSSALASRRLRSIRAMTPDEVLERKPVTESSYEL